MDPILTDASQWATHYVFKQRNLHVSGVRLGLSVMVSGIRWFLVLDAVGPQRGWRRERVTFVSRTAPCAALHERSGMANSLCETGHSVSEGLALLAIEWPNISDGCQWVQNYAVEDDDAGPALPRLSEKLSQ
jgi:hypothetical protein